MKLEKALKFHSFKAPDFDVEIGKGAVVFVNRDHFGVIDYADPGQVHVFPRSVQYYIVTKWPYP